MYKEKEEESAGQKQAKSSWGTLAWSETLSPMLGLRGKQKMKKKAIECCSGLHGQINRRNSDNAIMQVSSNHEEHLLYNNVINANDAFSAVSLSGLSASGLHHCGQESNVRACPLRD
ncbi:hypothetical protein GOP47_0010061 [Adiantum capillus-veneris]|uniref:Uncharacterized protein n=1 Tax=Adiantum capillus-veneris TaxID=13818 RepID=A0A9D4UU15_ADICA|nr:hypothetical protein GOP47_0010061 [Adiantum capillus-veneris]